MDPAETDGGAETPQRPSVIPGKLDTEAPGGGPERPEPQVERSRRPFKSGQAAQREERAALVRTVGGVYLRRITSEHTGGKLGVPMPVAPGDRVP